MLLFEFWKTYYQRYNLFCQAKELSVSYPKLIQVCTLHRICETIHGLYVNLYKLVANGKKIFMKLPGRIEIFKNNTPDTLLPETPVHTRWGAWLDAPVYYAENFEIFRFVVNEHDSSDASSIAI
jgi:hypothetical protein